MECPSNWSEPEMLRHRLPSVLPDERAEALVRSKEALLRKVAEEGTPPAQELAAYEEGGIAALIALRGADGVVGDLVAGDGAELDAGAGATVLVALGDVVGEVVTVFGDDRGEPEGAVRVEEANAFALAGSPPI